MCDHDRAVSVLSTAREIVDVAETQLSERRALSEAWQEMLNAANEKVPPSSHSYYLNFNHITCDALCYTMFCRDTRAYGYCFNAYPA